MNRKELVKKLAERLETTQVEASRIFDTIGTIYYEAVINGEDVPISRIGKIKVIHRKPRKFHNISTNTIEMSKGSTTLKINSYVDF